MSATANTDGRTVSGGASISLHDQEVGIAEPGIELAEPISLRCGRMLRGPFPLRPGGLRNGSRADARNHDLVRVGGHLCAADYPEVLEFGVGVAGLGAAEDLPAGSQLELRPPFVWHHAQKPLEPEVGP